MHIINFNPRFHERSDDDCIDLIINFSVFQSTLPREERRRSWTSWKAITTFQSTLPREERRKYIPRPELTTYISIHASTRGATAPRLHTRPTKTISIHASTRGATSTSYFTSIFWFNFNPRFHERSDQYQNMIEF